MRLIRVFPRRTKATPTDELAYVGPPDLFAEADEVHVSVAFTWDIPAAERLAKQWARVAPVKVGGPAYDTRGEAFTPGLYLKPGYTITSRGCPNHCWFCSVWRRDGDVRELPIQDGWNVLDDNLLACSPAHIDAVFEMLTRQPRKPEFTGGLEAARLRFHRAQQLRELRAKQLFFAYDTPDDLEPLREAGRMLLAAGFTRKSHALRCYVLCGYPRDTLGAAERRMYEAINAGFTPMAMVWRNRAGTKLPEWQVFQRKWARPAAIYARESNAAHRRIQAEPVRFPLFEERP